MELTGSNQRAPFLILQCRMGLFKAKIELLMTAAVVTTNTQLTSSQQRDIK